MTPPNLLFVSGDAKTSTSTVVGMLNCSPDICLLYEVNFLQGEPRTPRGADLVAAFPESSALFSHQGDLGETYARAAQFFASRGHRFTYFGDKILSSVLTDSQFHMLAPHKLIFLVRDLRTWLCKNIVVDCYGLEKGQIQGTAIHCIDRFIESFLMPRCLRLRMEDVIHHNGKIIGNLENFLQLDLKKSLKKWWSKVGHYPSGDPRGLVPWWIGHDSSRLRPLRTDTVARLNAHPFWDRILPIFDKYYQAVDRTFSADEISTDRMTLGRIAELPEARLSDLYASSHSVSFGSGLLGWLGHRSQNVHTRPFKIEPAKSKPSSAG
jgi:hypothetical protein